MSQIAGALNSDWSVPGIVALKTRPETGDQPRIGSGTFPYSRFCATCRATIRQMSRRDKMILLLIRSVLLVITGACGNPQTTARSDDGASCRRFAQAFYDWYVPLTQTRMNGTPWGLAVRSKAEMFDPDLSRAVKADSDAKAQAKGELVGIDFDPFVGTQDPADHYEARKVTSEGNRCLVEIWRASPNDTAEKTGKPEVIAEMVQQRGQFRFLNFRYLLVNADLRSILAQKR
jgi:hypothetical protein